MNVIVCRLAERHKVVEAVCAALRSAPTVVDVERAETDMSQPELGCLASVVITLERFIPNLHPRRPSALHHGHTVQ